MKASPRSRWASWRRRKGLTQAHLAALVGLHKTTITLIEGGHRAPTLRFFVRLCDALELSDPERLEAIQLSGEVSLRSAPDVDPEEVGRAEPKRVRQGKLFRGKAAAGATP